MLFFNQTEQNYFDDFAEQHRQFIKTYFAPHESPQAFIKRVSDDAYKYGYFFIQGSIDLFNAAFALCKSIYALITLSFDEAQLSAIESANYFASWGIKHGFCLLSLCLDLVQQITKLVFGVFFVLGVVLIGNSGKKEKANKNRELNDTLDSFIITLGNNENDIHEISTIRSQKVELLITYSNLKWDPKSIPIDLWTKLGEGLNYLIELDSEFDDSIENYNESLKNLREIENIEENIRIYEEKHAEFVRSAIQRIAHLDFLLNSYEEIYNQSKAKLLSL